MKNTITNRLLATNSDTESDYITQYTRVQEYIISEKLPELRNSLFGEASEKNVLMDIISSYLMSSLHITNDVQNISQRIYDDMTGYSFLNRYFDQRETIEEININSWESIEVRYTTGERKLIEDKFHSPSHARDVLLRILHLNNKHLDDNTLLEVSNIGANVRMAAAIAPLTDKDIGVAASIRFIHSRKHAVHELIDTGMLSSSGFNLLLQLLIHGVSMCFCGSTGSGKTTLAGALLRELSDNTRIITIEAGTREFDLIKRDKNGRVINNVVHLQTRPHRDSNLNVDLQTLLDLILKFHPDLVVVGEMVSEEAFIAQETARTGHTVLTTIHTNNAYDAYYKMFTLGIRKYTLSQDIMLKFMADAYPIIVYLKQYADNKRRIQSVLEGRYVDNKIEYNELYTFQVTENITDPSGKVTEVIGEFRQINKISDSLRARLISNGITAANLKDL